MSGLREALEKLCAKHEEDARIGGTLSHQAVSEQLNELLAAHPVEPAPVASRERVAEVLHAHRIQAFNGSQVVCLCDFTWRMSAEYREHMADALLAAGVFRDEATVEAEVAEQIATVAEEYADDLEPPTTSEWLELRSWFKGLLHEVAAKAREIGSKS